MEKRCFRKVREIRTHISRLWSFGPALLIAGVACLANAVRCGRVHCYLTGPIFLLAAAYSVLAGLGLVPMRPGVFLDAVLVMVVLAHLVELPLGRYRKKL